MILLSILGKTYAFALGATHPCQAIGFWALSLLGDLLHFRSGATGNWRVVFRDMLLFNCGALVAGWATYDLLDAAAMRWKDGIPGVSSSVGFLLRAAGLPVADFHGDLFLTTMAGPLRFAASLDNLGATLPACCASFCGVYLLWTAPSLREAARRFGWMVAILALVAVLRLALATGLFIALCDFISYESEELPVGPFVKPETIAWLYLPFLLAAGPLVTRLLRPPPAAAMPAPSPMRWPAWLAGAALLPLLLIALWEPNGQLKNGTVLINTYHTQWSRTDRPYDREWYGADSGYNYACLKRWFEVFYNVRELKDRIREADLAKASVLILYLPDRPLSDEERRLLLEFVRRGGGLFLIGDHTNVFGSTSHLNAVCRPFGFFFRDDILFDLDEDFFQMLPMPSLRSPFLHGMSLFKFRGPTSIQPTSWLTRRIMTIGHSKSMRAIYSVNNFYPPPHDHPSMRTGRFCVSAAARFGQGRVVAFADSTIFSNFEIFYPGKYEYLLNVVHWLNHRDSSLGTFMRRCSLVAACCALAFLLFRARAPRQWLGLLLAAVVAYYAAFYIARLAEAARAEFPAPRHPSRTVFFAAAAEDPAYRLQAFTTETPYDQRFDVFIQWVLRTGAFSGFYVTDAAERQQLYQHLRAATNAQTAIGLIVRQPDQLAALKRLAGKAGPAGDHMLLMFSRQFDWNVIEGGLRDAGLVSNTASLAKARTAWPEGETVVEEGGRRLLLVFSAERFSDQAMGFSEKIVPNANQKALFDQAFSLVDQLFDVQTEKPKSAGTAAP